MLTLPITKPAKQQEWKIILTIAQNNGFPLQIIHNLKEKTDGQKTETPNHNNTTTQTICNILLSLKQKITDLFKPTNLNIVLHATNTIHQQLTDTVLKTSTNSSRIYKFKCGTCNILYVEQ
jgi:hypothetical protein